MIKITSPYEEQNNHFRYLHSSTNEFIITKDPSPNVKFDKKIQDHFTLTDSEGYHLTPPSFEFETLQKSG